MTGMTTGFIPQIDIPILGALPKEGTNVGLKPMGATAKYLAAKYPEWGLTTAEIGGRLKSMRDQELVIGIHLIPVNTGLGWQITKKGERKLAEGGQA